MEENIQNEKIEKEEQYGQSIAAIHSSIIKARLKLHPLSAAGTFFRHVGNILQVKGVGVGKEGAFMTPWTLKL
jgi:hypothetical protein